MTKLLYLASGLLLATPTLAQTTPATLTAAPLTVRETAPNFKGQDAVGRPVELAQLLQKGPVVLYFCRG